MTNQPKFAKFVATAATATLVASAIVPVASAAGFSDVADTNSHAENINALVTAGLINGYEDGTFKPNAELTRGHVVKMLGRWVEAQGKEIPADWNKVQRFDDVAVDAVDEELVKYAALVKDAGVFNGSNGDLNAAENITRENMALVLDRAYNAIFGTSLVEKAASADTVTVADLATAKEEAHEAIQALRNLGISNVENFQPKETVTRAQFASFLNRTINGGEVAPAPGAATIESLTATGKSELTVTFDGAVNTEVATFKVAKGSTEVTVTDVDWNEDKTAAVLTVDETFGGATYNVTVSGVAGQDLTASVATAREQVTSVEFLSDYLVLTGKEAVTGDKEYKQAIITFAVYNQYGEDITKEVNNSYFKDLDVSGIDIYDNATAGDNGVQAPYLDGDGKFVAWVDADEDDDATGTIEMTYERNEHEFDVEHNVTLSDEAEPSQVEIVKVYSPTNDELNVENLEDNKDFYVLFKVKDQFGVEIDPEFAKNNTAENQTTLLEEVQDGIRVDVSDDDIFEVADEDQINVENVDGEYYFAIKIFNNENEVKGGDNTVTFRSKATGEETSQVINVSDSDQPHSIELGLPDEVIAGDEDVYLPVFAYNEAGELLTDAKALNEDERANPKRIKVDFDGASKDGRYTFVEKGGKVFLKFTSKSVIGTEAEDFDISIEVEKSGIENELNMHIEPNAHAEKIVGLKDKALQYALKGDQIEIEPKDLIIEDQYGRVFDDFPYELNNGGDFDVAAGEGGANENGHNYFTITATGDSSVFTIADAAGDALADDTNILEEGTINLLANNKGSETIAFTLTSRDVEGNVIEDTLDLTFRSLEADDFDSITVESDGVLQASKDWAEENEVEQKDDAGIEVFGLIGDLKVEIFNKDNKAFEVSTQSKYVTTENGVVVATEEAINDGVVDEKGEKYDVNVLVTINETGETISHKLTLVNEDAKVEKKFELIDNESLNEELLKDITINISSNDDYLTSETIFGALETAGTWDIEDQFDEDVVSISSAGVVEFKDNTEDVLKLTITEVDAVNDKNVIEKNGTNGTQIKLGTDNNGLVIGDSFDLTISIDGKSQTVKVYLVPQPAN